LKLESILHAKTCRSTGYGSLELWIRYFRQGITFKESYTSSNDCRKTVWNGSAFKIAGGYIWEEVYAEAEKENVIVVGGSDPVCFPPSPIWPLILIFHRQ
jgi:hypothetical protein